MHVGITKAHGGGKNVPGIPGAHATRNFTYLTGDPLMSIYIPPFYVDIIT